MELVGEKRIWNSLKWNLCCTETRVQCWVSHSKWYNSLRASSFFIFQLWDAFHQQTQNPFNCDCRPSILHFSSIRFLLLLSCGWLFICFLNLLLRWFWLKLSVQLAKKGDLCFDMCQRARFARLEKDIGKQEVVFNFPTF